MAINDHVKLKGVTHLTTPLITENLEYGLVDFFRWGFLGIGAFQNISYPTPAVLGGERSQLRLVKEPRFSDGRIWEGFRSDWVWETGIPTDNVVTQPIHVSGVTVNGTFYPTATTVGAYAHYIDYNRGRVVFDSAISTSSTVRVNFAHRTVSITEASKPWFRKLMDDSYEIQGDNFLSDSGNWSALAETRLAFPVIGVNALSRGVSVGAQLGGGQNVLKDVIFYIYSDNETDVGQLTDIITYQQAKTIWLLNRDLIARNQDWPLDYKGELISNPKTYPQMVAETGDGGYRWRRAYFREVTPHGVQEIKQGLYTSTIRARIEIFMPNI